MVQDVYNYFILKMKNNQSAVDLKIKKSFYQFKNRYFSKKIIVGM